VFAADAGPMQIQSWEGAALSRAETVLQGSTHDTVRAEIGYGEKVSQRRWSKKVEEGIGLTARQRDAQRLEVPRVFELERVVSCRRADPWWRTKLNFGSGEPFDDLHRSPHLGQRQARRGRGPALRFARLAAFVFQYPRGE
jgi:hypothetical protein